MGFFFFGGGGGAGVCLNFKCFLGMFSAYF